MGAKITSEEDLSELKKSSSVIFSSAIPKTHRGLTFALTHKKKILHRSELLARFMQKKTAITIAGTHGKTTTTSLGAWLLETAHKSPGFLIGGAALNFDTTARSAKTDGSEKGYFGLSCPCLGG